MFDSVKRRPRHRVVKAVIAAAGAAAVGGALFAVQANAAPALPGTLGAQQQQATRAATANIMVKVKPDTRCVDVQAWTADGKSLVGRNTLDYTKGYNPAVWNSTAIVAPVGSRVDVYQETISCDAYYSRMGPGPSLSYQPTPYVVQQQGYGDYWLDASR